MRGEAGAGYGETGKFSRGRPLESKGRESLSPTCTPRGSLSCQGRFGHRHWKVLAREVGVKRQEVELNIRQKRNKILTNV